jgi:hypothetical protein
MIELFSGTGLLISCGIFLFLWFRDRKYPDQKKTGFGFIFMGALMVIAHLMDWL